jgi:uncharacterized membrane protein
MLSFLFAVSLFYKTFSLQLAFPHTLIFMSILFHLTLTALLSKAVRRGACRPCKLPHRISAAAAAAAALVVVGRWTILPDKVGTLPPVWVGHQREIWG